MRIYPENKIISILKWEPSLLHPFFHYIKSGILTILVIFCLPVFPLYGKVEIIPQNSEDNSLLGHNQKSKSPNHPLDNSKIIFTNNVLASSFHRGSELTYNPYYLMSLIFIPQWDFSSKLFLAATFAINREISNSDITTKEGETIPGNIEMILATSGIWQDPWLRVNISPYFKLALPTSPYARAQTMRFSLGPGLSVSRNVNAIGRGLFLAFFFQAIKPFHEYTTSEKATPLFKDCPGEACSPYYNTGIRNANWSLAYGFDFSVQINSWVTLSLAVNFIIDYLYPYYDHELVNYYIKDSSNARYFNEIRFRSVFNAGKYLAYNLDFYSSNPQLAPDASYYRPFFNRYLAIAFGIGYKFGHLFSETK